MNMNKPTQPTEPAIAVEPVLAGRTSERLSAWKMLEKV